MHRDIAIEVISSLEPQGPVHQPSTSPELPTPKFSCKKIQKELKNKFQVTIRLFYTTSCKHPTRPPSSGTLAPGLTLLADDIHLVAFLDESVIRGECGDCFGFFDVGARDEFAFLEFPRVFEELVLEAMIDVFLDDDVLFVALWEGEIRLVQEVSFEDGMEREIKMRTPSHSHGSPYASKVSGWRYFRLTLMYVGR